MPSHNFLDRRTIVVSFKLFDSTTAMTAAFSVIEQLLQQLGSLQQLQQTAQSQPSAEIALVLPVRGSQQAIALLVQAIDNSAYQLEELQSSGQIAHFELSYKLRD
ncbi:hypothetical protein DSM107010_71000 [Chroococcidiopsis cubana SAG 39.79]|uniref:ACT domain-containing protein n=2 Tax=Chroococcidiopsis TaxID=54298 RepID=A0AB37U7W0_9CYAN|nr:hypothetical protein DSM107010_71000 [Chroococcidiopsis cubana SAG 39.79]